ncbi:MAG: peptidoglycan bridge formation glycyltransferase FemA/FemB family protein [Clostridia bacterium]|nr:peptidoglycan bridge formation glycyltransferase FemA/FemB family protein [Clostridia bacterium]
MPILNKEDKNEIKRYNEFLNSSKYTRLTQSLEWGKVKNGWESEAIYLEENSKIVAAMHVLIQKVPKLKYSLMYCPRGPICDAEDIDMIKKLIKEAEPIAKKYNAFLFKFDPAVKYSDELNRKYIEAGFKTSGINPNHDNVIQPSYDAILNIDGANEEDLIKTFSEKTRYNIRLSKRKGVEVYYSRKEEDLKTFYDLYKITCKRDKIGCRNYDYFKRMLESFDEEHLRIYIAKHEEDKLSGAIAINYGPEMFYLYGASSNEKRNLMPNYSMQWEMIKWGLEKKCKIYNFGGIVFLNKENGLYKFKTGFTKEEGVFKYIGEIDYVYNGFIYFVYRNILPGVKRVKRFFRELKRKMKK